MKRSLIASLSLVIAAIAMTPATAAGQSPGTDSVSGSASQCIEFVEVPGLILCARELRLTIDVASGPAGEKPAGSVTWNQLGLTPGGSPFFSAEATCLSVSGNVAIVGVTGTWLLPAGGLEMPIAGLIRIADAGGPNSAADSFRFALQRGPEHGSPLPGPSTCSTFPGTFPTDASAFPSFANEAGDVVVTDAPALPTAKDQCKDGSWKNFGDTFKSQGQCVAFVERGPKHGKGGTP